ncbi:MAG: dihydropteroate synthase [Oscillospiraceae bacterium]
MIIIGEKLNGSIPAVADAIAKKDAEFLKSRAKAQADAKATFIDVCASVEESVEVETMKWMIDLVQEVCDTPICVDSPSAVSCVSALPFCNKAGLLNSVSLEGNKIDSVFPIIADTKWECVALLCDDNGIPKTVDRRMEVFHGIMEKAKQYGIDPSRLHIDPLVETRSTEPEAFITFAECCRRIKAEYPTIHVTSGLSNISFSLPVRKIVNQTFMFLSILAGMDSAIVDPTNAGMAAIIKAAEQLKKTAGPDSDQLELVAEGCKMAGISERDTLGMKYAAVMLLDTEEDEFCLEYIGAYREGLFGSAKK